MCLAYSKMRDLPSKNSRKKTGTFVPIMNQKHNRIAKELPDFYLPDVRKRLSPAALIGFFKMVEIWSICDDDVRQLLAVSDAQEMRRMRNNWENIQLERDTLMRISYLLGIFKAINILHGEKLADQWVSLPNENVIFGGQSPLRYMIDGGLPAMRTVRQLLDAQSVGN